MAPIYRAGIRYDDLIQNVTIKPGETVRVGINREGDIEERKRKKNIVTATVLRVYKTMCCWSSENTRSAEEKRICTLDCVDHA